MKALLILTALVLTVTGGYALALVKGAFDLSVASLEEKYRTPDSKFMDIDGVRVHYMDQGQGPVLVLLHASFMNLRSWDQLAADLSSEFRVVRLDLLNAGLTGPDPTGNYSMERNAQLLTGLLAALKIDQFALLATSSGGTVGFRYAAANPDRVTRLILVNSAGMPRTAATDPNRPRGTALNRWIQRYHKSRAWWQDTLEKQFASGKLPPPELVDMVYDMNRRENLATTGQIFMRNYRTGDPETTLGTIRAPTMILWGIGNLTVAHLEADVFEHWLTAAPTVKKKYPDVGHYFYLEIPEQFSADVKAFLSGGLDASLRRREVVSGLPQSGT